MTYFKSKMNILKSTCIILIGRRQIQLAKCGRMSGSKMWKNKRLKNVENKISGYSGYLKMWKNDVE